MNEITPIDLLKIAKENLQMEAQRYSLDNNLAAEDFTISMIEKYSDAIEKLTPVEVIAKPIHKQYCPECKKWFGSEFNFGIHRQFKHSA